MLLWGRTSLFGPLQLIYSVSLPRSSSRRFAYLAHCGNLSSWLRPASAMCMATHHPYIRRPLFSLMHCFQICAGAFVSSRLPLRITAKPLPLTHTSLKMQKWVKQINIGSSRLGARDAADSGGARMNSLMTQSVINDVAALFFIDSHSLRGQPRISEIRPGEGSQSHSLSINWVHNHIAEWFKKTWERFLVVF